MAHLICPRCKTKLNLDGVPAGGKLLCITCGACIRVARPSSPTAEEAVQAIPLAPLRARPVMAMRDPAYVRPPAAEIPVMARRERSSARASKQGMSGGLIAGLAGGAALGVAVIALGVLVLLRRGAEPEVVRAEPPPQELAQENPAGDPAAAQPVALRTEPAKAPAGWLASAPAQGNAVALNQDPAPLNKPPPNNPLPEVANPRPTPPVRPGRNVPPAGRSPAADNQPLSDAELDRLLASLNTNSFAIINNALVRLARAKPVDEQRARVIKTVTPLAKVTEFNADMHAAKVLGVWGDKEVVPTLLEVLNSTNVLTQIEATRSLGMLKDPRAAEPLARRLVAFQSSMHASAALKEIGSAAEKAVLPYLKNNDLFVRTEVCNILQVIGTQECLPELRAAVADPEGLVRMAAEGAVTAVENRKK